MKQKLCMLLCCLLAAVLTYGQGETDGKKKFPGVDNIISPSPNAASLGKFGGFDVTKYTGSINKAIELFNLKTGDLPYQVALAYSTNGIKVDDWGSQTGMTWTLGSHATITREVRGIPDDNTHTSVRNIDMNLWFEDNMTNLQRVKSLASPGANNFDGEYDMFHFNLFGKSGTFIIDNGEARLLNHTEKVKIWVEEDLPYKFTITTPDGTLFRFGNINSTEDSKSDPENPCEMGISSSPTFVTTAWYVDQIVSPKGDILEFTYEKSPTPFRVLRTFEERSQFRFSRFEPGDQITCPQLLNDVELGEYTTSCAKFRYLYPSLLKTVSSPDFTVQYEYSGREDLYGQKLLSDIHIKDRSNQLKKSVHLNYKKTVSTFPLEKVLRDNINSPDFEQQIKIRYFLESLEFKDRNMSVVNRYSFNYNNPEGLPHHHSLGQDLAGYANGAINSHFIPAKETHAYLKSRYLNPISSVPVQVNRIGDRTHSPIVSAYGLLTKITYPTGGYDSIEYEPHSRISRRTIFAPLIQYLDSYGNTTLPHGEGYAEPFIAYRASTDDETSVKLDITFISDWDGANPPTDDDGSFYYSLFKLIPWDGNTDPPPINDGDPGVVRVAHRKHVTVNYTLAPGKMYAFVIAPTGIGTKGTVNFMHASAAPYIERYSEQLPGHRVKTNIIASGNDLQEIGYEYNHFTEAIKNGKKVLELTDSASTNMVSYFNSYGDSYLVFISAECDRVPQLSMATYHFITSSPRYNMDVYMGSHIAYSHLLKRFKGKNGQDGFEASETKISSNEGGGVLRGDYTAYIPMSNLGWDHGLERKKYQGSVKESLHQLQNSTTNYYNRYLPQKTTYLNYAATVRAGAEFMYIEPGPRFSWNFEKYNINYYPLLSEWYKLDSVKTAYFDEHAHVMEDKVQYEYSPLSALPKKTERTNSNNTTSITRTIFADDAENPEPPGALLDFINDFGWYGLPLKTIETTGSSSKSTRLEYTLPNGLPALSKVSEWQNNDAPVTAWKAISYGNKNRLTAFEERNGIKHQFVWDATASHPLAHVSGPVIDQGGYASFEEFEVSALQIGTGSSFNTTNAFTGNRSLAINGSITCNNLNASTAYQVSVWTKSGTPQYAGSNGATTVIAPSSAWQQMQIRSGWTLLQKTITGVTSITISGNAGFIDELRIVPSVSRMETFTYEALVGTTSKVDQNHQATFYEYDDFGRLKRIRDADKSILKQFEYQYLTYGHQQPVWEATGNKRCKPCVANPAYSTNIQQQEEKDINPNSAGFNSTRWSDIGVSAECSSPADWQNTSTPIRCVKQNGNNTGETEQEQRDMNPCSSTANQTRWIPAGTVAANWQNTSTPIRCVQQNGVNTGETEQEQRDMATCSKTYDQTRWIPAGTAAADWRNTTTPVRCKKSGGYNTGETEQEQKDMAPCSKTYNQTRWVTTGTNITACPMPRLFVNVRIYDNQGITGKVLLEFFADAEGTIPATARDLTVRWKDIYENSKTGVSYETLHVSVANGTTFTLLEDAPLLYEWQEEVEGEMKDYYIKHFYELIADPGYQITFL